MDVKFDKKRTFMAALSGSYYGGLAVLLKDTFSSCNLGLILLGRIRCLFNVGCS